MSMLRSWFQSAAPSSSLSWLPPSDASSTAQSRPSSQLSIHTQETTSSTPARSKKQAVRHHKDAFAPFERSEAAIRRRLQGLLDAQAEGLLASVGAKEADEPSDLRRVLKPHHKMSSSQVVPVRQPQKRPLSLSAARQGIRDTLTELSTIKEGELETCRQEIDQSHNRLKAAKDLDDRQGRLREEITFIEENEDKEARNTLETQDRTLQEQIDAFQVRLSRLRDEQSAVRLQLSDITDSVLSKLSSYRQSQRLLESEVEDFLRFERSTRHQQRLSYMSLPAERRTLAMAVESESDESDALEARRQRLLDDREALGAGAAAWSETMTAVARFESSLRKGIESLDPSGTTSDDSNNHSIEDLLEDMDKVIEELEEKLEVSEGNGWKLLVCCIAAELEAFKQGRDMLRSVAGRPVIRESRTNGHEEVESVASAESAYSPAVERSNTFDEPLRGSVSTIRRFQDQRQKLSRSLQPAQDEDPDPDLLITARSDTSTEND